MHRAHNKFKDIYKLRKKCFTLLMTGVIVPLSVLTGGCGRGSTEGEDEKFENFTNALFCRETASNTISLHYSLKDPEAYGIEEQPVTFGIFDTDAGNSPITFFTECPSGGFHKPVYYPKSYVMSRA